MTREEFLKLADSKWTEIESLQQKDFYEFEKKFEALMVEMSRMALEGVLGEVPKDHRKKKLLTRFGLIQIDNQHIFSEIINGFRVSPYMQDRILYFSQMAVFEDAAMILEKTLRVKASDTMGHRMVQTYGQLVSADIVQPLSMPAFPEAERIYAMADGSMLFTDTGWQEVKAGRVFSQEVCTETGISDKRGHIEQSEYAAHLGIMDGFKEKFSPILDSYKNLENELIWLSDGASWMEKWISRDYPNATMILDFWHPTDRLAKFAGAVITDKVEKNKWVEQSKSWLQESELGKVIAEIKRIAKSGMEEQTEVLVNYLENNSWRMDYKKYLSRGLFIGSGAIESTNKTLVQARMKKSGQRWSDTGAQNILNLRVLNMSNKWDTLLKYVKNPNASQMRA